MVHLDADLAVTLSEDRPGTLAAALSTDLQAAHDCLQKGGFRIVQEQQVLLVTVTDEPGAAAGVFQRLAAAHINIKYSYLATGHRLVIATDNTQAALDVLTHR